MKISIGAFVYTHSHMQGRRERERENERTREREIEIEIKNKLSTTCLQRTGRRPLVGPRAEFTALHEKNMLSVAGWQVVLCQRLMHSAQL